MHQPRHTAEAAGASEAAGAEIACRAEAAAGVVAVGAAGVWSPQWRGRSGEGSTCALQQLQNPLTWTRKPPADLMLQSRLMLTPSPSALLVCSLSTK